MEIQRLRDEAVLNMTKRYLVHYKKNEEATMNGIRSTIAFRNRVQMNQLRECYYSTKHSSSSCDGLNQQFLSTGKLFVAGFDQYNRILLCCIPRFTTTFHPIWFLKSHYYMAERAIACVQKQQQQQQQQQTQEKKIVAILDFNGFQTTNIPPLSLAKDGVFVLRDHYPQFLDCVYMIDAPFVLRMFWTVLKPFVDPVTRSLVRFVSNDTERKEFLQDLFGPQEHHHHHRHQPGEGGLIVEEKKDEGRIMCCDNSFAMRKIPKTLIGGKLTPPTEDEMKVFLYETPFDQCLKMHDE